MIKDKNKGSVHFWQLLPSQGLGLQWVIKVRSVLAIVPTMECAMQCSMMFNDVQWCTSSQCSHNGRRPLSLDGEKLALYISPKWKLRMDRKDGRLSQRDSPPLYIFVYRQNGDWSWTWREREDSGLVTTKKCALCIFSGFRKNGDWNVAWIERKI